MHLSNLATLVRLLLSLNATLYFFDSIFFRMIFSEIGSFISS